MTLEEKISRAGRELGFAALGFTPMAPSSTGRIFADWLSRGYNAGMSYLRRQETSRADPRTMAPWGKSVVVAAARYPVNPAPGSGFSTYARGGDYHEVMRAKLRALADMLTREAGASRSRVCVDATPVPERELAVHAGLGWIGRQGQVVNPDSGCCLVLGEIITDAELRGSVPMPDQCGECRRCVTACPTGAIGEERLVDCRRCISYLTVEHRHEIPEDIRALMGEAVFGCDRCTAVCPWNRSGAERVLPEFEPRAMPAAEEILRMDERQFEERFAPTAVFRTGLERLKRNAAVALGNRASASAIVVAVLKDAASGSSALVRIHADWAIRRMAGKA